MKRSDTWCVNAFHGLQAGNSGKTRACCMIEGQADLKLGVNPISEHFNREELVQLRNDLNNGIKNPGCNRCWQEEAGGKDSKRIRDNAKYDQRGGNYQGLAVLDLNLGNTCNLRCRTCGPHSSSQWAKEYYDLNYADKVDYKKYSIEIKKYNDSYDDDSSFWTELEEALPTIKQLDFYGGEPFMSKKMWRVLEVAVEKGFAKDIELNYATNGSFWPEGVKHWEHFKQVNVSFSIDGIGRQFEYMRYLADWEEVKTNIQNAIDYRSKHNNIFLSWCITLSNLNIYDLPSILEEHKKHYSSINVYLNLVHAPKHFNISILPDDIRSKVLARLKALPQTKQLVGIVGFIENGEHDAEEWNKFLLDIRQHDNYRNEDYSEIFPEFANIIGYKK